MFPSFPTDGTYNQTNCTSIIFRTNKYSDFRKFFTRDVISDVITGLWRHQMAYLGEIFLLAQNVPRPIPSNFSEETMCQKWVQCPLFVKNSVLTLEGLLLMFPSFPTDGTYNQTNFTSIILRTNKYGDFQKIRPKIRFYDVIRTDFFEKIFIGSSCSPPKSGQFEGSHSGSEMKLMSSVRQKTNFSV